MFTASWILLLFREPSGLDLIILSAMNATLLLLKEINVHVMVLVGLSQDIVNLSLNLIR